jgi:CheY-like chemotaxis protein
MPQPEPDSPVDILVVDDTPSETVLLQMAFKTCQPPPRLHVVTTGDEALAFLRREGPYVQACRPDLIFLDLNMPGKHGLDVLAELSADADLRQIPSIVLSSSHNVEDIQKSYKLCANCYIAKPFDFDRFKQVIHTFGEFWLHMVQLPRQGGSK